MFAACSSALAGMPCLSVPKGSGTVRVKAATLLAGAYAALTALRPACRPSAKAQGARCAGASLFAQGSSQVSVLWLRHSACPVAALRRKQLSARSAPHRM